MNTHTHIGRIAGGAAIAAFIFTAAACGTQATTTPDSTTGATTAQEVSSSVTSGVPATSADAAERQGAAQRARAEHADAMRAAHGYASGQIGRP